MGRHADEFERDTQALQDRIQARIDRLKEGGKVTPLKLPDADLAWALQYAEFNGEDGYTTTDARRLETVLRRLAREAGYALPETVQTAGGSHD